MKLRGIVFFLFLPALITAQMQTAANDEPVVQWTFMENCQLTIDVETNVNEFDCLYTRPELFRNLCFQGVAEERSISFKKAELLLPIKRFDCGGKMINSDFVEMLYREGQPDIKVEFLSARWYPADQLEKNRRLGKPVGYFEVEITMVGESRIKTLRIYSSDFKENMLFSRGTIDLNMSEFGIEPPEKFLGMVKVKDQLTIHFDLNIKRVI
jgi:hypothetical protein